MSFPRTNYGQGRYPRNDSQSLVNRNNVTQYSSCGRTHHFSQKTREPVYNGRSNEDMAPSSKRRKYSASTWGSSMGHYQQHPSIDNAPSTSTSFSAAPTRLEEKNCTAGSKRDRENFEEDVIFMSRDEIERLSPSRKDGIDPLRETYLRHSYCVYLQNLGMRLELPQTTIGTAMVLCHRFFVRRSHACHDRFMIATAALFLAAKFEETARPLNDVLRASCEVCHKHGLNFFPNLLPVDWFEQYRERVTDAEHLILTTLNFELTVQHPYASLISVLDKLGLSQSVLVNLSSCLVSEGLRSSLWLQFKPHHIAAGAAYLAAKFLNFDLSSHQIMLKEFETTPSILQDVVKQLMELF